MSLFAWLLRRTPRQASVSITYKIGVDVGGRYIVCNACNSKSYNENDIEQLYCGDCHQYHPVVTRKFGGRR